MSNKVEGNFDFVQELMKNYVSNKALLETTFGREVSQILPHNTLIYSITFSCPDTPGWMVVTKMMPKMTANTVVPM